MKKIRPGIRTQAFSSNKPTHYILDHGDFIAHITATCKCKCYWCKALNLEILFKCYSSRCFLVTVTCSYQWSLEDGLDFPLHSILILCFLSLAIVVVSKIWAPKFCMSNKLLKSFRICRRDRLSYKIWLAEWWGSRNYLKNLKFYGLTDWFPHLSGSLNDHATCHDP